MISVHVKLFATLRSYRPGLEIGEAFPVALPEGSTVKVLIEELNLPESEIKIVFVNFLAREREYVLHDGDEIGLFPPVGGG